MTYVVGDWVPLSRYRDLPDVPGIYIIKNTVNGKEYVGQSISVASRIKTHLAKQYKRKYLYRSMSKYGIPNFVCCLYLTAEVADLPGLEAILIEERNTLAPNGLNMTLGGEGTLGFKHSEETKRAISEIVKKKYEDLGGVVPWRAKALAGIAALWEDPVRRAKQLHIIANRPPKSEAYRLAFSDKYKNLPENEKKRIKDRLAKNAVKLWEGEAGNRRRLEFSKAYSGGGNPKAREVLVFTENSFCGLYYGCAEIVAKVYSVSGETARRWAKGTATRRDLKDVFLYL